LERIWILSLLVNNHFGVLTRVTGLFSRRGYNIVSLSVGETHRPGISRITIQTRAGGEGVRQIARQLEKLEDVYAVEILPGAETVVRELVLAKLVVPPSRQMELDDALRGLPCRSPYRDEGHVILELTGDPGQVSQFLDILSGYTLLELCRTGVTAMALARK